MNTTNNSTNSTTAMEEVGHVTVNSLFPILFQTTSQYNVVLYKYLIPFLSVLEIFCGVLTIVIFWKTKLGNPTHMFLLGICVCDTMSSLSIGSISAYVFYFEDYRDYLPFRICKLYTYLYVFFPVFCHYTSSYLTVGLAIQRYICVVYPFVARRICSKKRTLFYILFSILCSSAYFAFQIHSHSYHVMETSSFYVTNLTVSACSIVVSNFALCYIHPILFIVLPLIILICIQPAMLRSLRRSQETMKTVPISGAHNAARTLSVITLWVVFTFVLCELPTLIYMCGTFVCLEFNLCSLLFSQPWVVFTNFTILILIVAPLFNFVIYIVYNRLFRQTLRDIFTSCRRTTKKKHLEPECFKCETNVTLLRISQSTSSS
ncbi:sex peptide receptor-like [Argopecten irradians]|uniref:sex peptide receptor-like n=1 Tax=Argopecten irradians TaxID=31199 RepID=UPI003717E96C